MPSRRELLVSLPLALIGSRSFGQALTADALPLPDPKTFQAGDLVWPKKPGIYVPYDATSGRNPNEEEERWIAERDSFIANVSTLAPYFAQADIDYLRKLTFREFYSRYVGDQVPDTPGVYATGSGIYVGHVGIIDIDASGEPRVIEALLEPGVVQHSYGDWLRGRTGEVVWLGRVRDLPAQDRSKIAIEARRYVGRPYSFWNFDLADDTAFYCSKLVWLSIYRSLGFAIDGDPQPKRHFWFSPKQLLYLKTIARLHDPGPYATK